MLGKTAIPDLGLLCNAETKIGRAAGRGGACSLAVRWAGIGNFAARLRAFLAKPAAAARGRYPSRLSYLVGRLVRWRPGCLGAGLSECEPLVAEVGDDLQPAAEGLNAARRARRRTRSCTFAVREESFYPERAAVSRPVSAEWGSGRNSVWGLRGEGASRPKARARSIASVRPCAPSLA